MKCSGLAFNTQFIDWSDGDEKICITINRNATNNIIFNAIIKIDTAKFQCKKNGGNIP